jgi:hypothetical protein
MGRLFRLARLSVLLATVLSGWGMNAGAQFEDAGETGFQHASPFAAPLDADPFAASLPIDFQRLPAIGAEPLWPSGVSQASYDPEFTTASAESEEFLEPDVEYYTLDELRAEMKKLAWTKGDYRIVPYGSLWGSAIYATQRTAPGPFILYIASATTEGEDDFVIDTRRSRIGVDIFGPKVPMFGCAESAARMEIDFHGVFGTFEGLRVVGPENQTGLQLRHAYAEVKNEDFRLLAGQTWDLVSPLNPGMLTYAVGWGAGNIGFRRMQIRYERYLHLADDSVLTLQGAIAQDIALDFINVAESANWPVLQGRCGYKTADIGPFQPLTIGVSGHIGEQGFDFPRIPDPNNSQLTLLPAEDDARIETWSLNVDARWPITSRMGIQGEFFTGRNLSTFLGGVIQGINRETRQPIATTGGWIELWYDLTDRLHSHVGYGIDNPRDTDVAVRDRTSNSVLFGNVSFDILPKMTVGLELSYWETKYKGLESGQAMVFEFTGQYAF